MDFLLDHVLHLQQPQHLPPQRESRLLFHARALFVPRVGPEHTALRLLDRLSLLTRLSTLRSKMYADLVSPTDPRISSSSFIDLSQDPDDGMEVDSNSGPASRGYQPIPSGPRRAKKAGNNGPIPTGPKAGNQAQQQQQGSGLLARFGVSQPTTKGGQQGKGGAAAGGGSLLARLK